MICTCITFFSELLGIPLRGCLPYYLPCTDHSKCYFYELQCNGQVDCYTDGSDEANCSACAAHKLRKIIWLHKHNMCLARNLFCDGYCQLPGCEDEGDCNVCPRDRPFKCGSPSTRCIYMKYVCDGYKSCDDFSDDQHCPMSMKSNDKCVKELLYPEAYNIRCPDKSTCIKRSQICDGKVHCP